MWYWGVGGLAAVALIGQVILRISYPESSGLVGEVWHLVHFFTILTNLIVAVVLLRAALTGREPNASWSAAITLWIVVVGASIGRSSIGVCHPLTPSSTPTTRSTPLCRSVSQPGGG